MRAYVLDSFALISLLEKEAGAARVREILDEARAGRAALWLSIINYGEVVYTTEREQGSEAARNAVQVIDGLPVQVVEAGRLLTFAAAHVKAMLPMSYADAFAVALAAEKGARVVTGDPEFFKAESLVGIEWIPR
jgi:ribonuclease VapC